MIKNSVFILITLIFSSCMTLNKAKQKMRDNPILLAEMCTLHFPITDKFIKGDSVVSILEVTRTDTVTIELEGKTIRIACPECKQQTKTIVLTDTIVRVDRANEVVLNARLSDCKEASSILTSKNNDLKKDKRNLIIALILSIIGLLIVLNIK